MKVGDVLTSSITGEKFKVLSIDGDSEYAWVRLLHLRYDLVYSNFKNNLKHLQFYDTNDSVHRPEL